MKLWVDDIRNAPDESWHVARTVTEAIRAIARFDFEEISLDHDISHQIVMLSMSRPFRCDETFQAVTYYIALKYGGRNMFRSDQQVPRITLHTSNPVGGDEMHNILKDAGIDSEKKYKGPANRLEMEV